MSNRTIEQQVHEHKTVVEENLAASRTLEVLDDDPSADDLLVAALKAVEEARAGSRAASSQSILVTAILW